MIGSDPIDQLGVVATRKWENWKFVRGHVVDRDEDDVRGWRLRPADREARVDCLAFLRVERAESPDEEHEPGRAEADQKVEDTAQPVVASVSHRCATIWPWRARRGFPHHPVPGRPEPAIADDVAPQLDFLYRATENFERAVQFADAKAGGVMLILSIGVIDLLRNVRRFLDARHTSPGWGWLATIACLLGVYSRSPPSARWAARSSRAGGQAWTPCSSSESPGRTRAPSSTARRSGGRRSASSSTRWRSPPGTSPRSPAKSSVTCASPTRPRCSS